MAPLSPPAAEPRRTGDAAPASAREEDSLGWLRTLLVVSVLAPLLLFVAGAWLDYRQSLALAGQRVDRTLRIADEHAQKVFETSALVLDRLDDTLRDRPADALGADVRALAPRLHAIAHSLPQVKSLWALDAEGRLVVADGPVTPAAALQHAWDVARQTPQSGRAQVTSGRASGTGDEWFVVSKPRIVAGRFAGVIGVTLDQAELSRLYEALVREYDGLTLLLYAVDGRVIARFPDSASMPPRLNSGSPWLALARAGVPHTVQVAARSDGRPKLVAFAPAGDYGVIVGSALGFASVEREWLNNTLVTLAFTLAAMLALGSITWTALRRARKEHAARREWQREAARRAVAEKALRESQRMEAMGQLTGGVAHDFNNLLMVVSGNLQILQRRIGDSPHDRQLDAMAQAVQRGVTLVRHLLAFSRRQALSPRTIDLDEAMPAVCALLTHSLRENIRFACQVELRTWPVRADRAELELALLNVAVNARDAMPGGGALTMTVRNATVADLLSVGGEMSGEFVLISVHDTGDGIPPEVLPRVFEPFFTTKSPGKGTGLGLSQVYGFTRQSGGTVTLQSPPGRGTTVTLWLPRSRDSVEASPVTTQAPPARGSAQLLVVEDDATVARVLAELLEDLGYVVTTAESGTDALAKLHAGPRVDLLLTDVVILGPMNGLQLARTVRSRFPSMPVIVMTGYAAEIARIGAEGFTVLTKPIDIATLARALDTALHPDAVSIAKPAAALAPAANPIA